MIPTLAAYFHRIDPFAIQLSQDAGLRWYGLSYLVGFLAAYLIVRTMARRGVSPLPVARVADFVFAVIFGNRVQIFRHALGLQIAHHLLDLAVADERPVHALDAPAAGHVQHVAHAQQLLGTLLA